jgi:GTP-binding protein
MGDEDGGASEEEQEADSAEPKAHPLLPISTGARPVLRRSGSEMAFEMNLEDEPPKIRQKDERKGERVADLVEHGQQYVLCQGGRGGLGNRNFATSRMPGEPGDEGEFLLELQTVADVGLVGYPNAGKSTLLTAISHARPKVAPYPFTTLTPQIGIVEYPLDYRRLTVCDVPGLIEGAHNNVGLGHAFLRHIERCKVIILLIDMAGTDAREPWDDYRKVMTELELYDPELLNKPRYVVANKMDEPVSEANLKQFKRKIRKVSVLPISAGFDEGIESFKKLIRDAVEAVESKK